MRFLLLGGTGQVGEEIRALSLSEGVEIVAPSRTVLDITDQNAIAQIIASEPWTAVINAAAYTEVDRAESEESLAFAINADAPARLAVETGHRGIPLIHISTDYAFDGCKGSPYVEEDKTAPINTYGLSKLAGERGVRAGNPRHVILRSSWVYSPYRKNFVRTILRLAAERDQLTIVADQRGSPTAAHEIGRVCIDLALRSASQSDRMPYGTYHFTGEGDTTWFGFADAIVDLAADRLGRKPSVVPIRTVDYPTPARRPADSRLDSSAIIRTFGIALQPWRRSLSHTIDRLLKKKEAS